MNIKNMYEDNWKKYNNQTYWIDYSKIIEESFTKLGLWDYMNERRTVLELGCGSGNLTKLIDKYTNCDIVGLDFSENMVSVLDDWIRKNNKTNIRTIIKDVRDINRLRYKFDIIISAGMIEYIDFKQLLKNIKNKLNKGGTLIFLISRNSVLNWLLVKKYWKANIYSKEEIYEIVDSEGYINIEIYDLSDTYFKNWYYVLKCKI